MNGFRAFLKPRRDCVLADIETLKKYSIGEIDSKEAKSRIYKTNEIPGWVRTSDEEFKDWVRRMGY